jgi:Sulfotransferase domain
VRDHSRRSGQQSAPGTVDFFIVGVQKSGTTALDHYLRMHPQIQMAATKEVHYFDDDSIDWDNPDHTRLESFFDWSAPNVLRGEATPIYTYWPNSLKRLRYYNTAAKLIVGLRHPSFRAFSHWRMETVRGRETLSFDDAIGEKGRSRVQLAPGGVHRVFSYVERGFYAPQVASALALFPRRQVFFYRADALWQDHVRVLGEIEAFLNVDINTPQDRRYVSPADAESLDGLSARMRVKLDELFTVDIRATASLTGLDLADWLDLAYQEPIEAPD